MNATDISMRCLELFENDKDSERKIERKIGAANGSISKWRKGISTPSAKTIAGIAKVYHTDANYILCLTDKEGHTTEIPIELQIKSDEEKALVENYREMNHKQKMRLMAYAYNMMNEEGN